jgi:hypothetical protein
MFGCLGRIGCLALLAVLGVAAWYTRDKWVDRVGLRQSAEASANASLYEPISDAAAARGREAVASLSARRGYVTLTGAEAASYLVSRFVQRIPPSAERVEAAVIRDRLELRAEVPLGDLGSVEALGPLRDLIGAREEIQVSGTLQMIRPGLAQYRVRQMRVRNVTVPAAAVPVLLREVWRGERPEGLDSNALAIELPDDVGQVRLEDGQVIIYRTVQ